MFTKETGESHKVPFMDIIEFALDNGELLKSYIERHLELFKIYAKSLPSFLNTCEVKALSILLK